MSEQLRIILIIIVSVSIFGLVVFVMVKNYIKNKIHYYLEEKNKKSKDFEQETKKTINNLRIITKS